MKAASLRSTAHNIADSLGSGIGLMVGVYSMDVFGEARSGAEGFIEVDFLRGTVSGSPASPSLVRAAELYAEVFAEHCGRHGVEADDFRHVSARYLSGTARVMIVEVEDREGRRWVDTYEGTPARRPVFLNKLGQLRRDKGKVECPTRE